VGDLVRKLRCGRPDSSSAELSAGVENAWKIHQSITEWTKAVDAKAAFALTLELALIATVISLTNKHEIFSMKPSAPGQVLVWAGLLALISAAGTAASAVTPQLRDRRTTEEARTSFIYFGHARLWNPKHLQAEIVSRDLLPQLSQQIVVMSQIAWNKHIKVRWSFILALLATFSLICAAVLNQAQ
jgi:hypothetical protein